MRFGLRALAAIPIGLMLLNISSAAFTFSLQNKTDVPGSTGSLVLTAFTDAAAGFETFTLSSITINYTNNASGITTTAQTTNSGTLAATSAGSGGFGNAGLVNYTIAPSGPAIDFGDNDTFTVTLSGNGSASGAFSNVVSSSGSITAVPEPGMLGLAGLGLVGLALRRRRSI